MNERSGSLFTALKIFGFSYLKKQKSLKLRSECARIFGRKSGIILGVMTDEPEIYDLPK
jgi:hypothetical protein